MAPKHKSTPARNSLHSDASSFTDHSPSTVWFRDDDAFKAFSENFSKWGIHLERQVVLSDSNMHGIDRLVPLFFTLGPGTRIPITPQLVADVLRVPRIEFPDYPSCQCLRTVSRDELMSSFCERPTAWGECLFTPCRPFAKGPRFMNMVMTFVLHLLSHYNSIIEPHARFLLSLLKHLTIDFPSHFILSIIDVHLDSASHDKLIFPSTITRILRHFSVPFPSSDHFTVVCHRLRYR